MVSASPPCSFAMVSSMWSASAGMRRCELYEARGFAGSHFKIAKTFASQIADIVTCGVILRRFSLGLLALFMAVGSDAAERGAKAVQEARFIGSVGCKSSSCHGGAGEKRNQFITWTRQDFHSRSYAILTNARSARMAEALGLPDATSSARCTTCHSPFQAVAPARLA